MRKEALQLNLDGGRNPEIGGAAGIH